MSGSRGLPAAVAAVAVGLSAWWFSGAGRHGTGPEDDPSTSTPPTQKANPKAKAKAKEKKSHISPALEAADVVIGCTAASPLAAQAQAHAECKAQTGAAAALRVSKARKNCFGAQSYEAVTEQCAGVARAWSDPDFTHSDSSLVSLSPPDLRPLTRPAQFENPLCPPEGWLRDGERGAELKNVKLEWHGPWDICGSKRPLGTNSRGEKSWLYHTEGDDANETALLGMDAQDVSQGSLGDCYFLSALALAATDSDVAATLIDDDLDGKCCYGVSFWIDRRWTMVWVDCYLPCVVSTDAHAKTRPRLVYASSTDRREIWPMVVEKAFAKLHGSYESIGHGGTVAAALQALTGGTARTLPATQAGKMWSEIMRAVEDPDVLVGAGTRQDASATKDVMCGLVTGHAYSVLHALAAPDHDGNERRLLLLRNPWGKGEWQGDWSDKSKLWSKNPACKAAVGDAESHDDDGRFWMEVRETVLRPHLLTKHDRLPTQARDERAE